MQRNDQRRSILAAITVVALLITGCSRNDDADTTLAPNVTMVDPSEPIVEIAGADDTDEQRRTLDINLSGGDDAPADPTATTAPIDVVDGDPLDDNTLDDLLGELDSTSAAPPTAAPPTTVPTTGPDTSSTSTTGDPPSSDASDTTTTAAPASSTTTTQADDSTTTTSSTTTTTTAPGDTEAPTTTAAPTTIPSTTTTTVAGEPNFPPGNVPPPQIGNLIGAEFPPPPGEPPADPGEQPLEVVRYQPDGDVDLAPYLTVTFNQPMVPLATLSDLDEADVPVTVTPELDGRWRWVGTRTLRFETGAGEPVDRLPAATEFTAEIPAGTTSASGQQLAEPVSWTFNTPPPAVTGMVGATELEAGAEAPTIASNQVFVATFDQRIDDAAVLDRIELTADEAPVDVQLASDADIKMDADADSAIDAAGTDRTVAFTAASPTPPDSDVVIVVGPDVPSLEGPRTTTEAQAFIATTHGPLVLADTRCDTDRCEAGSSLWLRFNNELDTDELDADQVTNLVTIEPALPGARIRVSGDEVMISGATAAQTDYTVTVGTGLRDIYGQTTNEPISATFKVGDARDLLSVGESPFIITDPGNDEPGVSVTSINHESFELTTWAVSATAWPAFEKALESMEVEPGEFDAPEDWQQITDESIAVDGGRNEIVDTFVDLSDSFAQSGSQVVALIEPTDEYPTDSEDYWQNRPQLVWVHDTTLALDAFSDGRDLVIWATDLETGEPVADVPVELLGDGRITTTDEDGLADIELTDEVITGLHAVDSERVGFLPGRWEATSEPTTRRWYVVDDRGIYKPGETARITGWVRDFDHRADGDGLSAANGADIDYTLLDAKGNELDTGTVTTNRLGGFNLELDMPSTSSLGYAQVEFRMGDAYHSHQLQIQRFRRPEFEVVTEPDSAGPYLVDEPTSVTATATYYSGGPLSDSPVEWRVSSQSATYRPPDNERFDFGVWVPWWYGDDTGAAEPAIDCFDCERPDVQTFDGRTDGAGQHRLNLDIDGGDNDLPTTVTAEATVTDVNRQAWSSRHDLLLHPANNYVGVRSDSTFVELGDPLRAESIVTDIEGEPVAGRPVEVTVGRVEGSYRNGTWKDRVVDPESCTFESVIPADLAEADDNPMVCEVTPEVGGQYRITAIVTDAAGRTNRTEITRWVSGGLAVPSREVQLDETVIVPDRETYEPGDTAKILVAAPWSPGHGVATVMHHGIESTYPFTAESGSAVVEIPIPEGSAPGVQVAIEMVGSTPRTEPDGTPIADAPARPAYATGDIVLDVSTMAHELDVEVSPAAAAVEPGQSTTVDVSVVDAADEPVANSQVAIMVVDEAVLDLTGFELADPLASFFPEPHDRLDRRYARDAVLLDASGTPDGARARAGDEEDMPSAESAADDGGTDSDESATNPASTAIRTDFSPIAYYTADAPTGADGNSTVTFELPDNLTRYRIMAIAVAGNNRFGTGEGNITAQLPLQVRPSPPRMLRVGDSFEFPVVLQNQTDRPMDVEVAVRADGLDLTGPAGRTVEVPANDRVEVRFPIDASVAGDATLDVIARHGAGKQADRDAASVTVPVYTPATAEAFATYGTIDADGDPVAIGHAVRAPDDVFTEFGGLEINTSSTALQALTDAVLYLNDYEYTTTDAAASRLIAITSLSEVLTAFDAEGMPTADEMLASARRDIDELRRRQLDDGGWSYWSSDFTSDPWISLVATHALVLANDNGLLADGADPLRRGLDYAADITARIPSDYSDRSRQRITAYAVRVLRDAGETPAQLAAGLWDAAGTELPSDALAMIWPSIADTADRELIAQYFNNVAADTAGGVTFATDYEDGDYVVAASSRRTDALVLEALIAEAPDSDLIDKTVAGLMASRTNGHWHSTYDNAFVLMSMKRYFDTFEAVTPDFVARAWLGDEYVLAHEFRGRQTDRVGTDIPLDLVADTADPETGLSRLILQNDGTGRLYYRLGLRYAPLDLELAPRDEGFIVERIYEPIGDPNDVVRNADGSWHIKAGTAVRVRLTMVADARRTHVALSDPLPAGLEAVNPSLAVSQTFPTADEDSDGDGPRPLSYWWGWNWFEHQELGDERVSAFTSVLDGGVYEYTYVARATTPGEYVAPPAIAEQMFQPETFGRSGTDRVVID